MSGNKFFDTIMQTQNPRKLELNPEEKKNHSRVFRIFIVIAVLIVTIVLVIKMYPAIEKKIGIGGKPHTVIDSVSIPETERITGTEGKLMERNTTAYPVPLVPKNDRDRVVVVGAELTLKRGYERAVIEAKKWAIDAKLVFVQSLGSIDLDGRSSYWQIGFGSKNKKKGYEIIMQGNKIISQKEIESSAYGFDLPKNWYDSGNAVISLQTLPQFSDAMITGLNFFYNTDGKIWMYSVVTSLGAYTTPVK